MRTIDAIKLAERQRLYSIQKDISHEAAIAFAKQTYAAYRAQRKMRPMKYGRAYREEMIGSCVVFRQYIRKNK